MTTATFEGKVVRLTIVEKAKMLKVIDIGEENCFAVPSGSNPRNAYAVQHDGKQAVYCPCMAHVPNCAHRIAVNRHLQTVERTAYNNYLLGIGA